MRVPQAILDQHVYSPQSFAVLSLPVLVIFPCGQRPTDALRHRLNDGALGSLPDPGQWIGPDVRHLLASGADGPFP